MSGDRDARTAVTTFSACSAAVTATTAAAAASVDSRLCDTAAHALNGQEPLALRAVRD